MTTRRQAQKARRLLRKIAYAPENDFGTGALDDVATQSLSDLESVLHEVGHLVAFFDGYWNATTHGLAEKRMSVEALLKTVPTARNRRERQN